MSNSAFLLCGTEGMSSSGRNGSFHTLLPVHEWDYFHKGTSSLGTATARSCWGGICSLCAYQQCCNGLNIHLRTLVTGGEDQNSSTGRRASPRKYGFTSTPKRHSPGCLQQRHLPCHGFLAWVRELPNTIYPISRGTRQSGIRCRGIGAP